MAITQTPLLCFLAINHTSLDIGWSEAWHIPDVNPASARATVQQLALARSYLLAKNHVIEWAAVRSLTSPYWEWPAIGDPLPALPQWDVCDNDHVGLLWRFQSNDGKWGNHLFRAIEDGEIADQLWTRAPFLIPGAFVPPPVTPALATKDQLYNYVLATFRDLSCHARLQDPSDPSNHNWVLTPWQDAIFRKVSSRAWGSKYHRVSWEAEDWTKSPGFTPCGTVVTVLRSVYAADCKFFSSGPTQQILYYYAAPGAAVFPYQTIFWGWARAKDIDNALVIPGEETGPAARTYSWGWSWGAAPGLTPDGAPQQFMGQTVSPWGSSPTTPPIYRIACDMPIPVLTVQDSGHAVIVTNVTTLTFADDNFSVTDLGGGEALVEYIGATGPSGSGTANYLARWTSTTAMGIGTVTDDGTTAALTKRLNVPWVDVGPIGATETALDCGDAIAVHLTAAGSTADIQGIVGGAEGRWLLLWFDLFDCTLTDNAAVGAGNWLFSASGDDVLCQAGTMAWLRWNSISNGWVIHSVELASGRTSGLVSTGTQALGAGQKIIQNLVIDPAAHDGGPAYGTAAVLFLAGSTTSNISMQGSGGVTFNFYDLPSPAVFNGGWTINGNGMFWEIDGVPSGNNEVRLTLDTANNRMRVEFADSLGDPVDGVYSLNTHDGIYGSFTDSTTNDAYTVTGGIITDMVPGTPPALFSGTIVIATTTLTFVDGDLVSVTGGLISVTVPDEFDLILEFDEVVIYAPVLDVVIPDEFDWVLEFDEVVIYAPTIDPVIADEFDWILEFDEVVVYVPATYGVHDSFTDTDGTLLSAHAADTGETWTAWLPGSGDLEIHSNKLSNRTDGTLSAFEISGTYGNFTAKVDFLQNAGTSEVRFYARIADTSNYVFVIYKNPSLTLLERVAGSNNILDSASCTVAAAVTATLSITCTGSSISANVNDGGSVNVTVSGTSSAGASPGGIAVGERYDTGTSVDWTELDEFHID